MTPPDERAGLPPDQDAVRRLLAEARHDEPVPPAVAARLDAVLAELTADRRGPSGTIGTNRPDGFGVVEKIAEDIATGAAKAGRAGFDRLAHERKLDVVTFGDWKKIEEAEARAAREGSPREKFVDIAEMIKARDG